MIADPLHMRCRDGIVQTLQSLTTTGLSGIETTNILGQLVFDDTNFETPAFICSIEDEPEQLMGGTSLYKRVRFPVRVYLVDTIKLQPEDTARYTGWRAASIRPFHQRPRSVSYAGDPPVLVAAQLLPGVDEAQDTQVVPLPVVQLQDQKYQRVISGFRVNVECIFPR